MLSLSVPLISSGLTRVQEPLAHCLWYDPVSRQCRHYEHRPQIGIGRWPA
ncbi:MAG: hypothetical protein AABP62_09865 [Planctomycetota bacterium]